MFAIALIALIYGPSFWAKRIIGKYNKEEYFSGTGETFAKLLIDEKKLIDVSVETTDLPDHYDPLSKTVRLNRNTTRKTL
ncbi:MAG: zinc metallopeptidase, partial [Bacteroidetes bacterium]|nr:zinc metallopeptidase [Bacteroidota bacterium]